ncbi:MULTISPECIES: PTS sugar transporter subunit IIB [Clostridium]|nr:MULTISPECIES: PTS sugar transporter subunit IIB [Clostridium]MDG5855194.1 PTS sugar transporter subunit IIB [Clostridium beijerinckii]
MKKMISLMRIDDRLIHGQVAFGWSTSLGINVILVVNDEAKNDQMKAMALNLAKPNNVTLYIRGVQESGEIVEKFAQSKKNNVLVLVKNTKDALELVKNSGGAIKELNVGGLRYEAGKQKLTDLVAVDENDISNLKEINDLGIEIEFRMLPRDKKKTLSDLLK